MSGITEAALDFLRDASGLCEDDDAQFHIEKAIEIMEDTSDPSQ